MLELRGVSGGYGRHTVLRDVNLVVPDDSLGERLGQQAGTLSGGEQRMLALAHPYLADSRMILLDEVSIGLAPKVVDMLFEHLHNLAAGGASLLLVEQYVGRALKLADYAYILRKG